MIGVINYGIGNLQSVANALAVAEAPHALIEEPERVAEFDSLIVPGVGAFGACMEALVTSGFREPVLAHAASGKPMLGICVGMQMLADFGTEFGHHKGLGLIPGTVVQIPRVPADLRLPHVGWNALKVRKDCAITRDLPAETSGYFVHSFHFQAQDESDVVATVEYGGEITAAIARGNVFGVQFHPEKSQLVGLAVLKNFAAL